MSAPGTDLVSLDPIEQYRADIEAIVGFSGGLTITTEAEAATVTEVLSRIAAKRKEVKEARLSITRPLDQARKAAIAQEKQILGPLETIDGKLRRGLEGYHVEQERIRRERQEAIERERREAEERAAKAAREAERERNRREYEAGRRKTEEAQERQERLAEEAQQQADLARMQEAVAAEAPAEEAVAAQSPAEQVPEAAPLRSGSGSASVGMHWQATVIDEALVPREYLKVDQVAINKAVKAGAREIPGVEIKRVPRASVRAA